MTSEERKEKLSNVLSLLESIGYLDIPVRNTLLEGICTMLYSMGYYNVRYSTDVSMDSLLRWVSETYKNSFY